MERWEDVIINYWKNFYTFDLMYEELKQENMETPQWTKKLERLRLLEASINTEETALQNTAGYVIPLEYIICSKERILKDREWQDILE